MRITFPNRRAEQPLDLTPILLVLATCVLLLQRFWLFAKVPLIMPVVGVAILAAYSRGSVALQRDRLLSYLGLGSLAVATAFLNGCLGNVFSLNSIAYLLVTYCVFVATPTASRDQVRLLRLWQTISLLCALLGILQFTVFVTTRQVFDLVELVPPSLLDNPGYATIDFDPTHTLLRANGLIFLGASFFSQFMALALVIDATFLRNPYRLGCFFVALLCALSGTGILMAFVALLASAIVHRRTFGTHRRIIVPLAGGLVVFLSISVLVPALWQYFATRVGVELTLEARDTSFYIRFVAPWVALYKLCELGIARVVLGLGPGWFAIRQLNMPMDPNLNPISQISVYYGVFATIAYIVFLWTVNVERYTRAQWIVMLTVLVQYLFCSGNLLAPNIAYVLLWFALVFYPSPMSPEEAR